MKSLIPAGKIMFDITSLVSFQCKCTQRTSQSLHASGFLVPQGNGKLSKKKKNEYLFQNLPRKLWPQI